MEDKLDEMRVSVVVPAYNREKTIIRCIDSIMNQTIPPYEIIVVDDGSTDKTIEILEALDCGNLRIIRQNHRGAQAARNLGIINARGEYIAFLDSDDEWLPELLEESLAVLQKNRDCAVYSNGYICSNNKKRLLKRPECKGNSYDFILKFGGPMFQSLLVKKQVLMQIGLLDENVPAHQEWDTGIRLAEIVDFVYIKKPLFIWHWHEGGTISKDTDRGMRGYLYIVDKHSEQILHRLGIKVLNAKYKSFIIPFIKNNNNSKLLVYAIYRMLCMNMKYIYETTKYQSNKNTSEEKVQV